MAAPAVVYDAAAVAAYTATSSHLWCSSLGFSKVLNLRFLIGILSANITTGRGIADQDRGCARGRSRGSGRVSAGILGNSGSSLSILTTLVTSQVAGALDQAFIMVPNPNYVPVSMGMTLPASAAPKSSHGSEPANAPPPRPILQQKLENVRERRDSLTTWLRPEIKKALYVHWETDKGFMHRCLTNRANKVSAKSSKYTGSLATFMKTKARLSKSLNRNATLAETFKYIHTLKEKKREIC
ncbi:hypothetical protein Ahy_B01g053408 [Arachis hypogaea]|uniref:Uncharacterized protein n=1 Tax=Arachis hypogaea TaxID=3818 RepID=A0A445ARP5_ARAHY|nr:hypothetical protein Ahy_B01g053408 [Arachis hypogaea]